MAITILDVAVARGAVVDADGSINGAEFDRLGLPFFGGCLHCRASIAAYNAHPSQSGYLVGSCCIGDGSAGFPTVEAFEQFQDALDAEDPRTAGISNDEDW